MVIRNKYQAPDLTPALPVRPLNYGIVLSITPTDQTYNIEVYRAPDNGAGAPDVGNAVLIDSRCYASLGDILTDPLPNDNAKRFYRWRHTVDGGTAGAYTGWVWARPDFLAQTYSPQKTSALQLRASLLADGFGNLAAQDATGQTAPGDLYVPNVNTVKVGTLASPSSLTKTIRIPFSLFIAQAGTLNWNTQSNYLTPNGAVASAFTASIVLPKGITVTSLDWRCARVHVGDTLTVTFGSVADGAYTSLASGSHSGTGWATVTTALSELVGNSTYIAALSMVNTVAVGDAKFGYLEITYTVPDYSRSY